MEEKINIILKNKYKKISDKDFSNAWYQSKNIKLKLEILAEAINNNIQVENTSKYCELLNEQMK